MKKNYYEELTDENLIKKRGLLKGVTIGFGIIIAIALSVIMYVLLGKDSGKVSIAVLIPLFMLPITFLPIMINLSLLNKEIRRRNIDSTTSN